MEGFEYKFLNRNDYVGFDDFMRQLNALAAEGWRVVQALSNGLLLLLERSTLFDE